MLTRDFNLKVKALSDEGAFEGLASPYGDPPDHHGDVMAPGSYKQAIAHQGKGYPLLWSHDQSTPLGLARIEDSAAGLAVHGELLMSDPAAQRAHAHIKMGSAKGLSIGWLPAEGKTSRRDDGARIVHEVRLFEVSVVAIPAAPRAQITSVKSLGDVRHVLKSFRDDQVDADVIEDLEAIGFELKRLMAAPTAAVDAAIVAELEKFSKELDWAVHLHG